jgi:hypothetical protein
VTAEDIARNGPLTMEASGMVSSSQKFVPAESIWVLGQLKNRKYLSVCASSDEVASLRKDAMNIMHLTGPEALENRVGMPEQKLPPPPAQPTNIQYGNVQEQDDLPSCDIVYGGWTNEIFIKGVKAWGGISDVCAQAKAMAKAGVCEYSPDDVCK